MLIRLDSKTPPTVFGIQAADCGCEPGQGLPEFSVTFCGWWGWGLLVCCGLGFMTHHNSRNKHKTVKTKLTSFGENRSLCVLKESGAAF